MKYLLNIFKLFLNSCSNVLGEKSKIFNHLIYKIKLFSFKNISLESLVKKRLSSSLGCKESILVLFLYPPKDGSFSLLLNRAKQ